MIIWVHTIFNLNVSILVSSSLSICPCKTFPPKRLFFIWFTVFYLFLHWILHKHVSYHHHLHWYNTAWLLISMLNMLLLLSEATAVFTLLANFPLQNTASFSVGLIKVPMHISFTTHNWSSCTVVCQPVIPFHTGLLLELTLSSADSFCNIKPTAPPQKKPIYLGFWIPVFNNSDTNWPQCGCEACCLSVLLKSETKWMKHQEQFQFKTQQTLK